MAIKFGKNVLGEIGEHALKCYPLECCGVVVALPDEGHEVVRVRNIQDEMHAADPERYPRTAASAYSGHPGDLKRALDMAGAEGHSLAAFYHSHPDHEAYFSAEDLAQATPFGEPSYPGAAQLVIAVMEGRVAEMKAFVWSEEEGQYLETEIERP